MLGNIIGIEDNTVILKLGIEEKKLNNLLVVLQDNNINFIGEITNVKDGLAYINLLGEMNDDRFVFGVVRKPSLDAVVKLISKEKVKKIISTGDYDESKDLYIGKSVLYDLDVNVNINDFMSNHFAILGSTGSGKSCSVARLLQNLLNKKEFIPYKSSIFMFDAYGEYHTAFENYKDGDINFKIYTTDTNSPNNLVRIPVWLLGVDDLALLLGATKSTQIPIIEKALKIVSIFGREENEVIKIKNDIIARALIEILSSGNSSSTIRDQLISVLSYYNTSELNLYTTVQQPGYDRELYKCFNIDNTGKLRDMELIMNFLQNYLYDDYNLSIPDGSFAYSLQTIADALDFALISEGILKSDKVYDDANILKVRLHSLLNSKESEYFNYPEYISKTRYIRRLLTADNGKKAQIINFNINYIDDRLAKVITKIYSKMLFEFTKENIMKDKLPIHILLEEAHRYVQNDSDIDVLGYNIFDRITKEGRKYGVILGLISQRPSEISETAISQCSNFLIFKMLHPKDVDYIRNMVPDVTNEIIARLRILQPGNCIAFGGAFKIPVIVKLEMPNPMPTSSNCNLVNTWFVKRDI